QPSVFGPATLTEQAFRISITTRGAPRTLLAILEVVVLSILILATRCANYRQVFVGGEIYFTDADCYARMTRVRLFIEHPGSCPPRISSAVCSTGPRRKLRHFFSSRPKIPPANCFASIFFRKKRISGANPLTG
ncbi:MAG: hypothetical protein DME70_03670, partial [Verrucomicrobia bacterium]